MRYSRLPGRPRHREGPQAEEIALHQALTPPGPQQDPVGRGRLAPLLEPASIAVVGASGRAGSFGAIATRQLLEGGYAGRVFPVNPRYAEVEGLTCYPSLEDAPGPVDLAVLAVPNPLLEDQLGRAGRAAASAAVIFASCYEDPAPGRPPLVRRLARLADEAGIEVCGGNCMGFLNLEHNTRVCGFSMPEQLSPGGVTFISHSGSAFSAMAFNNRALRFNGIVSTGLELNTTAADYLHYALDQPATEAVGLFLETVRDPDGFRSALDRAARRDVPVVVLKAGRVGRAREMITAHSGALAGEDEAYEALFRAYGVARVRSLDEMVNTLELFVGGRRASPGQLAAIHDSGGERALLVDAAADVGVAFAELGSATSARLAARLEEGLAPTNPLDAWGTGNDYEDIYVSCMDALLDDPATAALAFCVDLTTPDTGEKGYVWVAKEIFGRTTKAMAVLSNLVSAVDAADAASLRAAGVPVLEGTYDGLLALRHLFDYRDFRARPETDAPEPVPPEIGRRWRARLATGAPMGEGEALQLLSDYGIPAVSSRGASGFADVLRAAETIGWPVVLKTAAPAAAHKSDLGGVVLGIGDAAELRRAYGHVSGRLGPHVLVQQMIGPGVELALGIVRDPQFGPLIMVAAGGVLIELLRDRAWALPPVDRAGAAALVDGLGCSRLLHGARGMPAADAEAVACAVAGLSGIAEDLGDAIEALDVNPLVALPEGCVAVDALVVPRPGRPGVDAVR